MEWLLAKGAPAGALLCLLSSVSALAAAQAEKGKLTAAVNLVQLTAIARDSEGRPVEDLGADDFIVEDEGHPQKIGFIEFIRGRDMAGRRSELLERPEVAEKQAQLEAGSAAEPWPPEASQCHHILIVIEPVTRAERRWAVGAVKKFLRTKARATECVAIVDAAGLTLPFTNDHRATLAELDRFSRIRREAAPQASLFFSVASFLGRLSSVGGRKSMVVFTTSLMTAGGVFLADLALQVDAALYPVDSDSLAADPFGGGWQAGTPLPLPLFMDQVNALTSRRRLLAALADATGGRLLGAVHDLSRVFDMVREDAGAYYMMGYYLPTLPADGKFRRISVKVRRRGVKVRAKVGYFTPKTFASLSRGDKVNYLYEALLTDRPFHDIEIRALAAIFPEATNNRFSVPIGCELRWPYPIEASSLRHRTMALVASLTRAFTGEIVGLFSEHRIWPTSAQSARYDFLAHLAPGRYFLKVVAADFETNALRVPASPSLFLTARRNPSG